MKTEIFANEVPISMLEPGDQFIREDELLTVTGPPVHPAFENADEQAKALGPVGP